MLAGCFWLTGYNLTMNIENVTTLQPKDYGFWVDPARPVLSLDYYAEGPHRIAGHAHSRAQILFPIDGVYHVNTPIGNWVVPATQAIWIPPHIHHEVFANTSMNSLILFVDETYTAPMPHKCIVINVSPLLYELFKKAVAFGNDYSPGDKKSRFVTVLLDELNEMEPAPMYLPMPRDKRLLRLIDILLNNPADNRSLPELSHQVGASERTVARKFRKETGFTFADWRKQHRLLEAIDRLGQGKSVGTVALDLGYKSSSAFIAMFRRSLGVSPGHYIQKTEKSQRGLTALNRRQTPILY
jgi:AraC-like DNA-binding protein